MIILFCWPQDTSSHAVVCHAFCWFVITVSIFLHDSLSCFIVNCWHYNNTWVFRHLSCFKTVGRCSRTQIFYRFFVIILPIIIVDRYRFSIDPNSFGIPENLSCLSNIFFFYMFLTLITSRVICSWFECWIFFTKSF